MAKVVLSVRASLLSATPSAVVHASAVCELVSRRVSHCEKRLLEVEGVPRRWGHPEETNSTGSDVSS